MSSRFRDATIPDAPARPALLLANLGTPQAPTAGAVRRYLGEFLHDYRVVEMSRWLWCPLLHFAILPLRARKVARAYASIWTPQGSPLLAHSRALATALQAQLPDFDVRLGMRYGEPSIASALRELQSRGVEKLLVLPLYPQYSASTTAAVFDAVANELGRWRRVPELRLVGDYHDDEGWLDALTASVQSHWDLHGRGEKLLLSFHGLPQRFVTAGDPYARQCEAGAQKLAARLGLAGRQLLRAEGRTLSGATCRAGADRLQGQYGAGTGGSRRGRHRHRLPALLHRRPEAGSDAAGPAR